MHTKVESLDKSFCKHAEGIYWHIFQYKKHNQFIHGGGSCHSYILKKNIEKASLFSMRCLKFLASE